MVPSRTLNASIPGGYIQVSSTSGFSRCSVSEMHGVFRNKVFFASRGVSQDQYNRLCMAILLDSPGQQLKRVSQLYRGHLMSGIVSFIRYCQLR